MSYFTPPPFVHTGVQERRRHALLHERGQPLLRCQRLVPTGPVPYARTESFNLTEYTRATWYIQKQQVTGYQNLSTLFCVTATYALEGKKVPLSNDTVATVYNYANEGRVNGPNQNAENMTLCARAVDPDDPSKLAVAPCFLPNALAGPCTPALAFIKPQAHRKHTASTASTPQAPQAPQAQ